MTPFETADLQKLVNYNLIMADKDNTYSTNQIKKLSECHSSLGKNNQLAAPKLSRWKDLNQAIIDWWNNDAIEATSVKISEQNNFQFYDPIQKKILSELFTKFRELYPKKNVDFEFSFITKEATKQIMGEEYGITTHFTYEFTNGDYSEYIRLKTAHDPEPALIDRAIISKFQAENEEYITAALGKEELIDIDLVDNPDEIIEHYFKILEEYLTDRQKIKPGDYCNFCNMSSTCGQFPLVSEGKINNRVRQVKVSKTNLVKLNSCERRAAWNVQYGLPREDYVEFETESDATKFHNYAQKMLVNNSENLDERNIDNFNEVTSTEDQVTRDKLFKKYQGLISKLQEYSNLEIKDSEYQLGFTCIADGVDIKNGELVDKKVATVFMGKADLVARVNGVPLIIELKTRPEIPEDLLESQLYALGASRLLNEEEVIILHVYSLENSTQVKERRYAESELNSIKEKFESIAKKIGSWVPYNALSPKYNVGDWCGFCEFRNTCSEYRVSDGQKEVISLEEIIRKEKEELKRTKNELSNEKENLIKEHADLEEERREKLNEILLLEQKEREQTDKLNIKTKELTNVDKAISQRLDKKYIKNEKERLKKEIENIKKESKNSKTIKEKEQLRLRDIEEELKLKEPMLNNINNQLSPILVVSNLENDLLNLLKIVLKDAGYETHEKINELDEKLSIETRTWEGFRGKKEPNPFTDARYLIKLIEFSINNENHVPKLSHFKNLKNEFNDLRDVLNKEHHTSINPNHVRVVELGTVIIKVIKSILKTKHYSGETKDYIKEYSKKANSLVKPFKKSLAKN
ncbi:MAG: hypothetical protein CL496_01090 [Actinobacteria bacterium]|nr:hypothetical protein [Actinomycetota bacterium]